LTYIDERVIFMDIILKRRTRDHVITFWEKTQDEEIRRLFPFSIESLEKALILFKESLREDALSYGKVIYFKGKYIGDIWCYNIDESDEKSAMISVVIFEKELWGKGIATEAANTFLKEIFDKFDIEKIGAFTYSNNYGSIGLLKKVGFSEIETFVEDGIESKYFEIQGID
jgi:RimJ/RimL family protein N-acetyltransferase